MSAGPHLFWITSRAAGTAALILASLSVAVGLYMSRPKAAATATPVRDLRAVHEGLSLVTLAMIAIHGLALLGDGYLHPGLGGIAVPFTGGYRPVWTGLGILGGYGLAALGLSYYFRSRIGASRWRRLHRLTALFWALGLAHTLGSGTDAGELWFWILNGVVVAPALAIALVRWTVRLGDALEAQQIRASAYENPLRGN